MNRTRDNVFEWLSDEKNRRDLKTGIVIVFSIIAIFIYQGFRYGLTWDLFWRVETIYDTVFILFILSLIVNDLGDRAEFDEGIDNKRLEEINKDLETESDKIKDFVLFSKQIKEDERIRYKQKSEEKRYENIRELEIELAQNIHKDKQKKIKHLENQIKYLEEKDDNGEFVHHVEPKKFERYSMDDFLSEGSSKKNKKDISINYKSKRHIKRRNLSYTFLRTFALVLLRVGLSGDTGSIVDILVFMALVLPISFMGGLMVYENTRYDMRTNEYTAKRKKLKLLQQIMNVKLEVEGVEYAK